MQEREREDQDAADEDGRGNFSFSFGFGRSPAGQELDRLPEQAGQRNVSDERMTPRGRSSSLEVKDGVLLVVSRGEELYRHDFLREGTTRPRGQADAFAPIATIRSWLNRVVSVVAVSIPIALAGLGVATGQTFETTFYMGVFGLLVCLMMMSTLRMQRSPIEELWPLMQRYKSRRGNEEDLDSNHDIDREL